MRARCLLLFLAFLASSNAQGLRGGCYVSKPGVCTVEISAPRLTVDASIDERVAGFWLRRHSADGNLVQVILSHSTADLGSGFDVMPVGDYSPLLPGSGFVAECGQVYFLSLLQRTATDSGSITEKETSRTAEFACPPAFFPGRLFSNGFEQ